MSMACKQVVFAGARCPLGRPNGEPAEVSCRAFTGQALHWVLGFLGIYGLNILELVENASHWLWIVRYLDTSQGLQHLR